MTTGRQLQMRCLRQEADYRSAFDLDVAGFNNRWWNLRHERIGDSHYDWLSFVLDGEEVARAEVNYTARLGGAYVGPALPADVIDITFIEVRADRRGEGIGRDAVARITSRYLDQVLIAFSEQADDFWTAVGWERRPRADGDTRYRPLFVWGGARVERAETPSRIRQPWRSAHDGNMNQIILPTGELAYEHDGLLWKPEPGCTSTFEESVQARIRWLEIFMRLGGIRGARMNFSPRPTAHAP